MASTRDEALSFLNPSTSSPIAVSDAESYLFDNSQIGSASGSFQNEGFLVGLDGGGPAPSVNSDAEFGFYRPDYRQSPLVGTVEPYERHVFLCYKNPDVWPPRIEAAESDRLPRLLSAALTSRKADMKRQIRLTICEGHDDTETSNNGDVLIFPDMIRYRRLTHFDVETFVEEVLVKDGEWLPGTPEALRGWYIFVCCHGTSDRRCGVCGPALVRKFIADIESYGLQNKVSVCPCSHIGGHKYAGNVIIFGPNMGKEITGHWYGYVTPDDVSILLEQHIRKGQIANSLWRGQMGLSEEQQKNLQTLRSQLNGQCNLERSTKNLAQVKDLSVHICGSHVEGSPCCPANIGLLSCQNTPLPEKRETPELNEEAGRFKAEKNKSLQKQISRHNSGKGASSRKACSMPSWFESWEREDTYAGLAVIGAILSVAFAYNCYKQLK